MSSNAPLPIKTVRKFDYVIHILRFSATSFFVNLETTKVL